jgi:hypothetical protein
MRSILTFVAIVACTISCGFSIRAANEEPVATETPLQKSSPVTTASEKSSSTTARPGEQPKVLCTSPNRTFRIEEERGRGTGKMEGAWITTAWIVPTTEPAKRVALGEPFDDTKGRTFFISPDERWICAAVHFHSQLDGVMLYRRKAGFQFELVTTDETEAVDHPPEWEFDSGDGFVDTSDWEDTAGVHD